MKHNLTALIAGLLFGAGLTISTMVDPARVLGFLDILGVWDPTLAFVMLGGIAVYLPGYHFLIKPRQSTLLAGDFHVPQKKGVDKPLIIGSTLFGIGWGLSGICPGPGLANLSGGLPAIWVFVLCMLLGMLVASKLK
ncbi:YeeE/YedE family protein [Colwellia sp. MB3u-4]|uniref:YeeE/YedE family protein n=1 Tax=Colwellia sp. MB3u-4 TaxID=2759822 RepID=UPI0015F58A4D|nr:YeeE/YedE family protein [Colwellia sp. MB3u-4]MBA6287601.1 YeeE/YedE family protein [Colwellia sp. MB3u-4]